MKSLEAYRGFTPDHGDNVRDVALEIAGQSLFDDEYYEKSLANLFSVSRQAMAIRLLNLALVREVQG